MALNHDLSELFRQMAAIMDIKGESVFKSIAFSKVSRLLKDMTFDIRKCCDEGTLKEVQGIGDSSRKIIEQFIKEGKSTDYEELAASVPAGLVPGQRPLAIDLPLKLAIQREGGVALPRFVPAERRSA